MTICLETIEPHSYQQRILMEFFLRSKSQELVMACATKFGKTFGAAHGLSLGAWVSPNRRFRWVGPIYEQALLGLEECKNVLPGKPYVDINMSGPKITLKNNSNIQFWHGQKPTSLEGAGIHGYVLDECAKMKEDVYTSAITTTTRTEGKFVLISTPLGKNWFFRKAMEAKESMDWHLKRGKIPPKMFITAPTSANPYISAARIEQSRKNMSERLFRQFYLAQFIDDSSIFINFRSCIEGDHLEFDRDRQYWYDENISEKQVVVGCDWAKKKDYTVMVALDYTTNPPRMVGFLRFTGLAYTSAVAELIRFCRPFKEVSIIYHDATGIGEAINDLLMNCPYAFEPIVFTNNSKSHMVNLLGMTFEQRKLIIPHWDTLLSELDAYECQVSPIGTMSFNAPSGFHDDCVCALMLANAAAQEYVFDNIEVRDLSDKNTSSTEKREISFTRWYDKLIEDEDDISNGIQLL